MGAFNIANVEVECTSCGRTVLQRFQFKFGHTWQREYSIGDVISWGGNDIGEPGHALVSVVACREPCPLCGVDNDEFRLLVRDDRIVSVRAAPREPIPITDGAMYEVLED